MVTERLATYVEASYEASVAPHILARLDALDVGGMRSSAWSFERVQAATVFASEGDRTRFERMAVLAEADWRDALVAGGLADEDWPDRLNAVLGPLPGGISPGKDAMEAARRRRWPRLRRA